MISPSFDERWVRSAPSRLCYTPAALFTDRQTAVHETGIAQEIYRLARQAMAEHGEGRLERVTVAVGELSAVEPELLRFAWQAVIAGGPDSASELQIEWRPARQTCAACGEIEGGNGPAWLRLCPRCEMPLKLHGGDELDMLRVSFVLDGEDGR